MRADRLVAILLVMQARGRVTAAELAEEFEVSVSTARRDLEALSAAGVPVYPQPGRGGGWSLIGGARTDLTGLTGAEVRALFMLTGPAGTGGSSTTGTESASAPTRSALRKLVRALPETFRSEAEAAAEAVVVDPARWGGEPGPPRPPWLDTLQDAVVRRRKVRLVYTGRTRDPSERIVDPWGLADKDGIWYLVAGTTKGRRTFRVDRVVAAELTAEAADRPDDLDLPGVWESIVDEVEQRRSGLQATFVVAERFVPVLRHRHARQFEVVERLPDGRVRARLSAPTATMIAQDLAGWGGLLDVEGPDAVRAELVRLGRELVAGNAG